MVRGAPAGAGSRRQDADGLDRGHAGGAAAGGDGDQGWRPPPPVVRLLVVVAYKQAAHHIRSTRSGYTAAAGDSAGGAPARQGPEGDRTALGVRFRRDRGRGAAAGAGGDRGAEGRRPAAADLGARHPQVKRPRPTDAGCGRCPASGAPSSRYTLMVQVLGRLYFPGVERDAASVADFRRFGPNVPPRPLYGDRYDAHRVARGGPRERGGRVIVQLIQSVKERRPPRTGWPAWPWRCRRCRRPRSTARRRSCARSFRRWRGRPSRDAGRPRDARVGPGGAGRGDRRAGRRGARRLRPPVGEQKSVWTSVRGARVKAAPGTDSPLPG